MNSAKISRLNHILVFILLFFAYGMFFVALAWSSRQNNDFLGNYENIRAGANAETEYSSVTFKDKYTITRTNPVVQLKNEKTNYYGQATTVEMDFVILNSDKKVLYESGYIPPNAQAENGGFNAYENLSAGNYELTLSVATRDTQTKEICRGIDIPITVEVIK